MGFGEVVDHWQVCDSGVGVMRLSAKGGRRNRFLQDSKKSWLKILYVRRMTSKFSSQGATDKFLETTE